MTLETRLRISVVALFVDAGEVLLLHQMTLPEIDCWDLPGGGIEPEESLEEGLRREVQEETGITEFKIERLLTVTELFYLMNDRQIHTVNIIYLCSLAARPLQLISSDAEEVGEKGIQWLNIKQLRRDRVSTRTWKALQAADLIAIREKG
ncbi:MAG: NUDIX domain-containing protein [Jaaginema sp. PMC 1080.18]|nr:NUDIX domain-containing protein [Jaaginema sp. PMC 1080.18]MEC4866091.1 NUDIX domain-containing protein [Jaaginema sp. PMC 1078.18]